jgi:hypothetical protein
MACGRACQQLEIVADLFGRIKLYRGYSALAVAYTGLWALVGSGLEYMSVLDDRPHGHVALWVAIALFASFPVAARMLWTYYHSDPLAQEETRNVTSHFVLCLTAGVLVTATLVGTSSEVLARLPGIWMILFSLGIFASRPHLPPSIVHAAFFYFITGGLLLWIARQNTITPFVAMGPTFFCGQLFTAWVFHRQREGTQE